MSNNNMTQRLNTIHSYIEIKQIKTSINRQKEKKKKID